MLIFSAHSLMKAFVFSIWFLACPFSFAEETDSPKPINTSPFRIHPPDDSYSLTDVLKNIHGSYDVSLMGPTLTGPSNATYNMYLSDIAPIQLYHVAQLGYQVTADLQIGVKEAIVQNLADGIVGNTGIIRNHSFDYYDPAIYFSLPNLIPIKGWFTSSVFSFSLPLSSASQNQGKITAITINEDWNVAPGNSPWTYGFSLYLNPQFYSDPMPEGLTNRQTLYGAIGHNFGYLFSPIFGLNTSTNFNFEHRSPDPQGFLHLGQAVDDVFQITATLTPQIYPLFMTLRGYCQFLIWNPSFNTTILGAEFSLGF